VSALYDANKSDSELSESGKKTCEEYFEKTKGAWEVGLALVLNKLCKKFAGPFALGAPHHASFSVCRGTDIDCRRAPGRMVARTGDSLWEQKASLICVREVTLSL